MQRQTELILNEDGSIYHLNLLPEDVAPVIITVGDPDRVSMISKHFDFIEIKKSKREFVTHTGILGGQRITVISTGIGTGNIDIVLNELDALFNMDFDTGQPRSEVRALTFIRIGTSGALQRHIDVDTFLISKNAVGLDGIMNFYESHNDIDVEYLNWVKGTRFDQSIYQGRSAPELLEKFAPLGELGNTLTCSGFYGPQDRFLRIPQVYSPVKEIAQKEQNLFTNLEMETAAFYALAALQGHKAISLNAILANRATGKFSLNPNQTVEKLITTALPLIQDL